MSKLDAFFKFKENNTDVKTEIIAGITIFLAMAYILIVNPAMLSETGWTYKEYLLQLHFQLQ